MREKAVIVVQARMSSTRLPGKVMMPILGKSLLVRMIERLQMVRHEVTIVIATTVSNEDDIIVLEAEMLGIPFYRGSINNLVDRHYKAAKIHGADLVLKIPSDCPLIDPQVIDEVLDHYFANREKFDYVSNLHPATWPDGNDVEVMTIECLEKAWQHAAQGMQQEHTTPYIWENAGKFRIGNVSWSSGLDYSMSHRFTIDYADDYEFIKRVFEELYPAKKNFSCDDILELLVRKPEIYQLNAHYAGVNWYRNHLDELKTVSAGQTKQAPGELTTA